MLHPLAPDGAPHRFGIRYRLSAAFLILFTLTLLVTVVGVLGLRQTDRSIDEFESRVMPEIAKVLELAERVSQLAAVAPGVADTTSLAAFESDRAALGGLLEEARRLSGSLPAQAGDRLEAAKTFAGLDRDLASLLELSHRRRLLSESSQAMSDKLGVAGDMLLNVPGHVGVGGPLLLSLWGSLVAAAGSDNDAALGRAEADSEALWALLDQSDEPRHAAAATSMLKAISLGADNVFQLRRSLIRTERQLTTLVQLTRRQASTLGTRAGDYVVELRGLARQQRDSVRTAARSGESTLVMFGAAAIVIALVGLVYVNRLLGHMHTMTRVIARLAAGDLVQPIPATHQHNELGDLARAFHVFRDAILEKARLASGLAEQGRLLQAVFQSIQDGLAAFDAKGALVMHNQRFARMLPFPAGLLEVGVQRDALRQSLPSGSQWQPAAVWPGGTGPGPGPGRSTTIELKLPDGKTIGVDEFPMPMAGMVIVCRDLTENLAVQARLNQMQKMDVLGQLAGGIAHDFNNFLQPILGNLELIESRAPVDDAAATFAARARRSAESAARLTNRLLAFARPEAADVSLFSLADMLDDMVDLIEFSAGATIDVATTARADEALVRVDRSQLESAVLNLVLNAAAAMPGGGRLCLKTMRVPLRTDVVPPGPAAGLCVSDTGHGIPRALRDRVLEPFFTTNAPGKGNGLGLSIVASFARQSSGTVVIQSDEGQGTSVEIWLPICDEPAQTAAVAASADTRWPGSRVLLVDDDLEVSATIRSLLAELAVDVTVADSEASAWDRLAQDGPFDLVLSDVNLGPGGDGLALARSIVERHPGQRVALTSGLPPHDASSSNQPAGQFAFIRKPFGRQRLMALLGRELAPNAQPPRADGPPR